MKAAAEAVKSDKTIVDALQQAITNPGAFTAPAGARRLR